MWLHLCDEFHMTACGTQVHNVVNVYAAWPVSSAQCQHEGEKFFTFILTKLSLITRSLVSLYCVERVQPTHFPSTSPKARIRWKNVLWSAGGRCVSPQEDFIPAWWSSSQQAQRAGPMLPVSNSGLAWGMRHSWLLFGQPFLHNAVCRLSHLQVMLLLHTADKLFKYSDTTDLLNEISALLCCSMQYPSHSSVRSCLRYSSCWCCNGKFVTSTLEMELT